MKLFQIIISSLFLLTLSSQLIACQSSAEPQPTPDPSLVDPLIDTLWTGTMEALSAETRSAELELTRSPEEKLIFSLDFLYIGRTERPTNRTGNWYYDGSTLTLTIIEQDGEPVDQSPLLFAVNDQRLVATIFEKNDFDVNDFVLEQQ